jgi:hypothetical protein
VLHNVKDNGAIDCHVHLVVLQVNQDRNSERKSTKGAYVLPWHARVLQYGNVFVYIVTDVVISRDTLVVEILAWENSA